MYSTPLGTLKPLINFPTIFTNHRTHKNSKFHLKPIKFSRFKGRVSCSISKPSANPIAGNDDFVSRVLRENPSQIEPKYLIGDKLYTSKEKESLRGKGKVSEILRRLNLKALVSKGDEESGFVKPEEDVYLKDLLREHRGKLYVHRIHTANIQS